MSLSIIITASYIKSHPSIIFIKSVIESLKFINVGNVPIILAHDYNDKEDYLEYLSNLEEYTRDKPNITIIKRDTHGCLTGNVRNAFNYITTEYVLILQHDLPFIRELEMYKVIEDMKANPMLKHVRFNKRANIKVLFDAQNDLFGKQEKGVHYSYTRTPCWSDQNHICTAEYYRDVILKMCKDGTYMEYILINKSKTEEIHEKYGTYIFGGLGDAAYIKHTDGSKNMTI
jgi:hypothetical protein